MAHELLFIEPAGRLPGDSASAAVIGSSAIQATRG
jgi:hypothetical protein